MNFIRKIFKSEQEIKKSNFIAFLCPIENFENLKINLKRDHPKARHLVWAYRKFNNYGQILENQSDDGEPKGTSGYSCLSALRGADLINCGVLVLRYFGGIKLGTGGLCRAYGSVTNLVIKNSEIFEFKDKFLVIFYTDFAILRRFEHKLNFSPSVFQNNGAIWNLEFDKEEFMDFYKFAFDFIGFGLEFYAIPIKFKEVILSNV